MLRKPTRRHLRLAFSTLLAVCAAAGNTGAQVTMVMDIRPGVDSSDPGSAAVLGSKLLFGADDGSHGYEAWVSDGTEDGTVMLADIMLLESPSYCGTSSNPAGFVTVGDVAYFGATDGWDGDHSRCKRTLYQTDGTPEGTLATSLLDAGTGGSFPAGVMGGALYFRGWAPESGEEICKVIPDSDEYMIRDIVPGVGSSSPLGFSSVTLDGLGERLFFSAFTETEGWQPWISAGLPGDTAMLKFINDISWNATSGPFVEFQGKAWFAADDGIDGRELWVSDGTPDGTSQFMDLCTGTTGSSPNQLTVVGNTMFFSAWDVDHGSELWSTDGTVENTGMVTEIAPGQGNDNIGELTAFGGKLYFVATTSESGRELWVSDGTADGTTIVKDVYPGTGSSDPGELTVADGKLFFAATTPDTYRELWVSNGTAEGTMLVEDLYPGGTSLDAHSSSPHDLVATVDTLFFFASNDTVGDELWKLPLTDLVTTPAIPSGTSSGQIDTSFSYTTGGSVSLEGDDVQYLFDWDDGTNSDWLPIGAVSADHSWSAPGTYTVTAQARSATETGVVSRTSSGLEVTVTDDETIEAADVIGPTQGWEGVSYEFTFGATSSKNHQLQYSISWGDGETTGLAELNGDPPSVTATHTWVDSGQMLVSFSVGCVDHPDFNDYSYVYVEITPEPEEEISTPVVTGPATGFVGASYTFTVSATSNLGHDLEYLVFWGDGSDTGWTAFGEGVTSVDLSHTWNHAEPEPFPVDAEVRCVDHQIGSPNGGTTIEISDTPPGWIFGDDFEYGDTEDWSAAVGLVP